MLLADKALAAVIKETVPILAESPGDMLQFSINEIRMKGLMELFAPDRVFDPLILALNDLENSVRDSRG